MLRALELTANEVSSVTFKSLSYPAFLSRLLARAMSWARWSEWS